MAQPNKPAKTMSSRLLDMKFMQRAAASSPSASPSTPPEPSSKRQRLSNGTYNATPPSQPKKDRYGEDTASSEPSKRSEDTEFEGADRGDTKWYLSVKQPSSTPVKTPLRIVSAGFGALDAAQPLSAPFGEDGNDMSGASQSQGRRSFGNFNRQVEKQQDPTASGRDSSSASDPSQSEEDDGENNNGNEEDSDDPTGLRTMLAEARKKAGNQARAKREAERKEAGAESTQSAVKRRKKLVKLNGSASRDERPRSKPKGPCYKCGKMGHLGVYCAKSVLSLELKDAPR